jgi:hypothetical protein
VFQACSSIVIGCFPHKPLGIAVARNPGALQPALFAGNAYGNRDAGAVDGQYRLWNVAETTDKLRHL